MGSKAFTAKACNGYENVLHKPARMVQDVDYWINHGAEERLGEPGKLVCSTVYRGSLDTYL